MPTDQLHFILPPQHTSVEDERRHRKERLAAALRLFGR
ncbi:class II aldolase/adducin family protein, partial [Streptomyces sp. DSM 41529]|nr:class II aldolase/adducin family protein [Streptomyces sp. DSM 41529]